MTRIKLPRTIVATALCLIGLLSLTGARRAAADDLPVVEISAKRFAFTPDKITLKKGQTVKLRLHSEDVTHGFFLRPLKIDEEIPAGQTVEVTVTPQVTGSFMTICDHFCGANHGNMNMTIVVE
ncbi:MAG TPA: cupredoxin domain-containing protein [Candidatus Acidoferrales bacterium]|nr:cupredoxin domain-containing protein [Candidatus Acidoferrales bacterium]